MTLLPALKTYLTGLGITGPFFYAASLDPNIKTCTVLLLDGSHREDPTNTHRCPRVQIYLRRTTQAAAHADAQTIWRAFNSRRAITLTGSYRVFQPHCPAEPDDLGERAKDCWAASVDVNLSIPYSAAI